MTIKKAVTYTIWCDDGRYCNRLTGKTFVGVTKGEAVNVAKTMGWKIKSNYIAQCPNCAKRERS